VLRDIIENNVNGFGGDANLDEGGSDTLYQLFLLVNGTPFEHVNNHYRNSSLLARFL
jgi:hypothetical protein